MEAYGQLEGAYHVQGELHTCVDGVVSDNMTWPLVNRSMVGDQVDMTLWDMVVVG